MHLRPGLFKVATVKEVPVFVHWSFPAGGLVLCAWTGFQPLASVYFVFAFTLLVLLHELAHVAAAWWHGLKVFSVEISGFGGECRIQAPRAIRDTFVVYAAGLFVQLVLLLLAVAWLVALGRFPQDALGRSLAITFTFCNLLMLVVNIIPATAAGGEPNDGRVLWKLMLHAVKGHPHPFPNPLEITRLFPPDTALLSIEGMRPPGFVRGVEILNDSKTPMEFVVDTLMRRLDLDRDAAIRMMIAIHQQGGLLVPVDEWAEAQAIADGISEDARGAGHPLVCRAVAVATEKEVP